MTHNVVILDSEAVKNILKNNTFLFTEAPS